MILSTGLVLVVSRVSSHELGFFENWGVLDPQESPYVAYLNGTGAVSPPKGAQLMLVDGNKDQLRSRLLLALSLADAGVEDAFLLIHTGNNRNFIDVVAALDEEDETLQQPEDWQRLSARAFSLWSRGGLYPTFILNELCDYARSSNADLFQIALGFLRAALHEAMDGEGEGVEKSETRSEFVSEYLIDFERRQRIGLVASKPRLKRNPVAALIHDVLSGFDPLYIDFQVAVTDNTYWQSVVSNYEGKLLPSLIHLRDLITQSAENIGDLQTIRGISSKIISDSGMRDVDKQLLSETIARLELLVSSETHPDTFRLITAVDRASQKSISLEDLGTLRDWLEELRKNFGAIDHLYKRCRDHEVPGSALPQPTEQ